MGKEPRRLMPERMRAVTATLSRRDAPRAAGELAAATAFAALTALGARVSFHVPGTPVPVTGQVFCVLLAGGALGPRLGFIAMAEYLAAGAAGLPVFAHGGGPAALAAPSGGYLIAFPAAALMVGALAGRSWWRTLGACLAGVLVIHAGGAAWLGVWQGLAGAPAGLFGVLAQSFAPFALVDAVKAVAAASALAGVRRLVRAR